MLSIVVEIDTGFLPGWTLVGVVAETLTRGEFNVRIERVGRPEVKNMMLAPKEFDPVNRDLEIRDLYNMEDAFHLGDSYAGAFRARLDANLAFWDGLDGKQDWPIGEDGSHPLTDLVLADYLVVDVTKPYVEQGSFLEIELAARRGEPHPTCGGRTLNDDVMDTIFTQLVNAGQGPTIRDGVDAATRPGTRQRSRTWRRRTRTRPNLPSTTDHGRRVTTVDATRGVPGARRHPGRRAVRAPLAVRRHLPAAAASATAPTAASWSGGCTGSSTPPGRPATRGRDLAHRRLHLPRAEGARGAAGVPGQLRAGVPARGWRPGPRSWATSVRAAPTTGRSPWAPPTCTSPSPCSPPTRSSSRAVAEKARAAHAELPGIELIWRQDCYQLATGRTSFGFKDGIGQPAVEGSGRPATNSRERPLKAGEIILGYPDETGELPPMPTPDVLGRNGTYVVFRKLHTKVAAYRSYLRARAANRAEEDLLGAKMVGRWQSGAPLALSPDQDDPELGSRPGAQQRLRLRRRPPWLQVPGRCPRAPGQPA